MQKSWAQRLSGSNLIFWALMRRMVVMEGILRSNRIRAHIATLASACFVIPDAICSAGASHSTSIVQRHGHCNMSSWTIPDQASCICSRSEVLCQRWCHLFTEYQYHWVAFIQLKQYIAESERSTEVREMSYGKLYVSYYLCHGP